jgi:hypothetical protein
VNFVPFLAGGQAAEWASSSPADGQIEFACSGDTPVTFTWSYVLGEGETVGDKKWHYMNGSSKELLAFMTEGQFVPL